MKAESSVASAARSSRNTVYSRPTNKRASSAIHPLHPFSPSCGVQKSRSSKPTSVQSPRKLNPTSQSPSTRIQLELQRRRQQQIISLEREVRGLLEEEYRQDITAYMHQVELVTMSSPHSMDMQPEIQWHMRACLIEFLIEVHLNFQLRPETLYLTCNIVDRYVSRRVVYKKHYQLVGCAALWIASKFEDAKERVPTVRDLCEICRDEYDESAFIQMEGHVLATIAWRVGHPTAEAWLRVASVGLCFEDGRTQHVARFLMEITLFHREFLSFPPSVIAQAALLLARFTLNKSRRPFEETEAVINVMRLLDTLLAESLDQLSEIIVKKYSYSYYSKASTHIVHYYLQGHRYVYSPPTIVPVSRPVIPAVPCTPLNKVIPRTVQAWPSASSTMSSTPSFSGSDFSSEPDESLGPQTPPPNTMGSLHINTNVALEPLNLLSLNPTVTSNNSHAHTQLVNSSNKENRPTTATTTIPAGILASTENVIMQDGHGDGGTRSRKSSLEVVEQNIPVEHAPIGIAMDMCMPSHSPSSCDQATYIPPQAHRVALHSLAPNSAASSM